MVRIMLETWKLARKYAPICSFRKPFNTKIPLILLMSVFFAKNQRFLAEIVPLLKVIVWDLCWRFFRFVFSFCEIKRCYLWKLKFRILKLKSGFGLLKIGRKLEKWQWRHNFPTWPHRQLFLRFLLILSILSTSLSN